MADLFHPRSFLVTWSALLFGFALLFITAPEVFIALYTAQPEAIISAVATETLLLAWGFDVAFWGILNLAMAFTDRVLFPCEPSGSNEDLSIVRRVQVWYSRANGVALAVGVVKWCHLYFNHAEVWGGTLTPSVPVIFIFLASWAFSVKEVDAVKDKKDN